MRLRDISLIILALTIPAPVFSHDKNGPPISLSDQEISQFFTETKVVSEGQAEERCAESVLKRRSGVTPTLGVESTVGLGAALLIFIGVGVFAVGIAQAFQMVRTSPSCKIDILISIP